MEKDYNKVFHYQILRFVRNIISGEFINVAIIIRDDKTNKIYAKRITDSTRFMNFFPRADFDTVMGIVDSIIEGAVKYKRDIRDISKENMTFSFSSRRVGITDNFVKTLNMLFAEMILKYNK